MGHYEKVLLKSIAKLDRDQSRTVWAANNFSLTLLYGLSFTHPRCQDGERLSSPPIQDQDGDILAVIHTVMDFTGAPERLRSSFGLLRMSHLSAASLLPPLSLFLSLSALVRPGFSCAFFFPSPCSFLTQRTSGVLFLASLREPEHGVEQAGRTEGVSTAASQPWSARLITCVRPPRSRLRPRAD